MPYTTAHQIHSSELSGLMLSCQNVAHNVKSDLATQLLSVWSVSTHAHNFLNYVKIFFKVFIPEKEA